MDTTTFNETVKEVIPKEVLDQIKELEVRNSDVFLLGFPKSGTTWSQEMIWLILNDLNYEGAKAFVDERVPVLEVAGYSTKDSATPECHWNSIEFVKGIKDPRCIKSHLKWELLPEEIHNKTKKPKIIYIARNPKDVCLSSYYYYKNMLNIIDCSLEEFCAFFLYGKTKEQGNYWSHVLSLWKRKNDPNILFIKYEDMKNDISKVIQKVAYFLNKTLTKEEVAHLAKWLDFETMKNNTAVNHDNLYQKSGFMRVGKIGDHKNVMSSEMIEKFDSWIEQNLKESDYTL